MVHNPGLYFCDTLTGASPAATARPSARSFCLLPPSMSVNPARFGLGNAAGKGIGALAIVGIAMEIGIEPTARHAADLGIIPVVIEDACGAGHADAAQRSCEALRFAGDAIMTDTGAFCAALGKANRA
jgi:biuret amidohydrolase